MADFLPKGAHKIPWIRLIHPGRLDVLAKTQVLRVLDADEDQARQLYEHEYRFHTGNGVTAEPDDPSKKTFDEYWEAFKLTYSRIRDLGFDPQISTIPVTADGQIINGSHRAAICIHLGIDPWVVASTGNIDCSYKVYRSRGFDEDYMWSLGMDYLRRIETVSAFFFWEPKFDPDCIGGFSQSEILRAKFRLNPTGQRNLLYELYRDSPWISGLGATYSGLEQKRIECFDSGDRLTVSLVHGSDQAQIRRWKDQYRIYDGRGFSAVHSTDDQQSTISAVSLLATEPGRDLLNRTLGLMDGGERILGALVRQGFDQWDRKGEYFIFGSSVMELAGLRRTNDVDVAVLRNDLKFESLGVPSSADLLNFYDTKKLSVATAIQKHGLIIWRGYSFPSLEMLREAKERRSEQKDDIDVLLLGDFISGSKPSLRTLLVKFRGNLRFALYRQRLRLIRVLQSPWGRRLGIDRVVFCLSRRVRSALTRTKH